MAVKGGARDCPYTFMKDMVAGKYRLPWEEQVVHKDGTSCGFPPPSKEYVEPTSPGSASKAKRQRS